MKLTNQKRCFPDPSSLSDWSYVIVYRQKVKIISNSRFSVTFCLSGSLFEQTVALLIMEKEAEDDMSKGNFNKAREKFEMLLQQDKSKTKFWLLGKADCLACEGRLHESLPVYCEAFKYGKVNPDRLHRFVKALSKLIEKDSYATEQQTPVEDSNGLQCGVCTGLLYDPVTLPCGHSFCRLCLKKQESEKCVFCGNQFSYSRLKTNVILQHVLEKSFKVELEATRLRLQGNQLHRKKNSLEAIEKYEEAEKLSK